MPIKILTKILLYSVWKVISLSIFSYDSEDACIFLCLTLFLWVHVWSTSWQTQAYRIWRPAALSHPVRHHWNRLRELSKNQKIHEKKITYSLYVSVFLPLWFDRSRTQPWWTPQPQPQPMTQRTVRLLLAAQSCGPVAATRSREEWLDGHNQPGTHPSDWIQHQTSNLAHRTYSQHTVKQP